MASMSATITHGAVNPLAAATKGVASHVTGGFNYPHGLGAAGARVPMTVAVLVNAQDAGGNTIIGPGGYVDGQGNSVTITLSKDANSGGLDACSTSRAPLPGPPRSD